MLNPQQCGPVSFFMPDAQRTPPHHRLRICCAIGVLTLSGCGDRDSGGSGAANPLSNSDRVAQRVSELIAERDELDRTVWAREVEALRHEAFTVDLWDRINNAEDKLGVLAQLPFVSLRLPVLIETTDLENDIRVAAYGLSDDAGSGSIVRALGRSGWQSIIDGYKQAGWRLEMAEFYHEDFTPAEQGQPAESQFSFKLYAVNETATLPSRVTVEA